MPYEMCGVGVVGGVVVEVGASSNANITFLG